MKTMSERSDIEEIYMKIIEYMNFCPLTQDKNQCYNFFSRNKFTLISLSVLLNMFGFSKG